MPPIVEELIPCPDPWDVARRLAHLPHLLFLDSTERHPERGRYSYVMADPIRWNADVLEPNPREPSRKADDRFSWPSLPSAERIPGLPPFQGGLAGAFGYDLNRELERLPPMKGDLPVPIFGLGEYAWVVSFDHVENRAWWISRGDAEHLDGVKALLEKQNPFSRDAESSERSAVGHRRSPARPQLDRRGALRTEDSASPLNKYAIKPDVFSNFTRTEYIAAVKRVIEYIRAGDVFQVNLAQRLLAPLAEHPLDLYGRLRERCPSPYGCYFDLGDFQILSASPEQFLKVADGEVVTRPIKGTRPRGRTPAEDAALLRDLTTNPKDRAENVMIVDLLRNDLGRVCEYGSIHVPKVCEVESYSYVHHLVSEVRGRLRSDRTPFDLLRAAFPGGSVTGAPKVRAMEIIAELEPTARGPYCGSVGFIGYDGAMDSNILIRTFTAGLGWLQFPVGGGIVADSDPEREYEETLHKAAGLLRALAP